MDHASGGEIVIQTATPLASTRQIEASMPTSTSFRVEHVAFSLRDLEATRATTTPLLDTPEGVRLGVSSLGVDVLTNSVVIGLSPYSREAAATLSDLFPSPMVEIRSDREADIAACNSRNDCFPIKGGLAIQNNNPGDPNACTSGFLVRKAADDGVAYLLSAGHCLEPVQANFYHGPGPGTYIGFSLAEKWFSGTNADVGIIKLQSRPTPANLIMAAGTTDFRSVSGTLWNYQQPLNAPVCKTGRTTGMACGIVTATSTSRQIQGVWVHNLWRMSKPTADGDSGGPVWGNTGTQGVIKAAGTVVGTDTVTYTDYSTVSWAFSTLNDVATFWLCDAATYPC